jgi:hypothetical protein
MGANGKILKSRRIFLKGIGRKDRHGKAGVRSAAPGFIMARGGSAPGESSLPLS